MTTFDQQTAVSSSRIPMLPFGRKTTGHLFIDELSQRDLGSPLDLEPNELVDLVPVSPLQALVAEVDYHG